MANRQAAEQRGRAAETAAVWRLRLAGWRILARRWRSAAGEIDIVARRRGVVAFVEVKARAGREDALLAVTPRQQRRIARAAALFLASGRGMGGRAGAGQPRFDLVLVRPWRWPEHVPAAFDVPDDLLRTAGW
jgi:putative endonuclease